MRTSLGRWVIVFSVLLVAAACARDERVVHGDDRGGAGGSAGSGGAGGRAGSAGSGGEGGGVGGHAGTDACPTIDPPLPPDPTIGAWDERFYLPGIGGDDASLLSVAWGNGKIYAGGRFRFAGAAFAEPGIASWDPVEGWRPMGDVGAIGAYTALAVAPDGTVFAVFVNQLLGGYFLRRWDGAAWTDVAEVEGAVAGLAFDGDGSLLVFGSFTSIDGHPVQHLARWDGAAWLPIDGLPDAPVDALLVDEQGICIAGAFSTIGAASALGVACHDEQGWTSRDLTGIDGGMWALARDADGALVGAGLFEVTGRSGGEGGSIAKWDGTKWVLLGGGLIFPALGDPTAVGMVSSVARVSRGLLVGGVFTRAGGPADVEVTHLALWDGRSWTAVGDVQLGGNKHTVVGRILPIDEGAVVTGTFSAISGVPATGIVRWDGDSVHALHEPDRRSDGVLGSVFALSARGACGLYVGGSFSFVGSVRANNVARFDPESGWSSLGEGLPGTVLSIAVASNGDVYAGASTLAGSASHPQIDTVAVFRDGNWTEVGGGIEGPVFALAAAERDVIVAGGSFRRAGGQPASNIAAWDGERWLDLDGGVDGTVRSVAALPKGGFVAVGDFTHAGGKAARGIARWDGTAWSTYGDGIDGCPLRVALVDGRPVVGGDHRCGTLLARWTGEAWTELGQALVDTWNESVQVSGIAVASDGRIVVAGQFSDTSNGIGNSGGVAVLDGSGWQAIGEGVSMYATQVVIREDAIVVGGYFSGAGGRRGVDGTIVAPVASHGLARFAFPRRR